MPTPLPTSAATLARFTLRTTLKGSLATLDPASSAPYVSMVNVATDAAGDPLLLLSGLARHTANLRADRRSSLLMDTTDAAGAASSGVRLTLSGRAEPTQEDAVRHRYLRRLPEAEQLMLLADFGFWRLRIESAYLIAGFGRIQSMSRQQVCLPETLASAFSGQETALLAALDEALPAQRAVWMRRAALAGCPSPTTTVGDLPALDWLVTGADAEGVDFRSQTRAARLIFSQAVTTAAQAHAEISNQI